ncbi:MAG: lactate racemase domain-containing protein [Oscillospiraceae bacterium]
MKEIYTKAPAGISQGDLAQHVHSVAEQFRGAKRVLIVPPDFTRCYSMAGEITKLLYRELSPSALVHIIPALGTHMPMDTEERHKFFGEDIPEDCYIIHRWQSDTVTLGYVPASVTGEISGGLYSEPIEVELNHLLIDGGYDVIFSVGQVVPHEVVGMANYSKNIFVGLGGRSMINKSHMLSAICGIENALGVTDSPARMLYDYAQRNFIDGRVPIVYMQTVTTRENGNVLLHGLFSGMSRRPFELASQLSQELNITHLDRRAKKVVTYLDPDELKTTWVGNKGIYRTRMAVADGGELIILAPGVRGFGENSETDAMIRRYGYRGRDYILRLYNEGAFENMEMSAAHLIHGSSDGRFSITYATRPENLSKEDIELVGFNWADFEETARRYDPKTLCEGWNTLPDGEEIYFVGTPALGLWKADK